jgi:hypothetical protein
VLLAEIAEQRGRRVEGASGEGVPQIEQALADLGEREKLMLGRSPESQGRLDAVGRGFEREPLPRKGQWASPYTRLKVLAMHLAAHGSRLTLTERKRMGKQRRFIPATKNVREQRMGRSIQERSRSKRG